MTWFWYYNNDNILNVIVNENGKEIKYIGQEAKKFLAENNLSTMIEVDEVLLRTGGWMSKAKADHIMPEEEFLKLAGTKKLRGTVKLDNGKVWLNVHTCISSYKYGGTCNCISHPTKKWVIVNQVTGGYGAETLEF